MKACTCFCYPASFVPGTAQHYDVTFPDFPGCVSQGDDLEDAIRMAQQALTMHLSGMLEDGEELPTPSSLDEARTKEESFAMSDGYVLPEGILYRFVTVDISR